MTAYGAYVGTDGQSYPEVAARAVQGVHAQRRSPVYGYIRSGASQRIYLFPNLPDARAWFEQAYQVPDHDYIAVFSASNLRAPVAGLEHQGTSSVLPAPVGVEQVGQMWPFFLGLPLGAAAGYGLRWWQESPATREQVTRVRDLLKKPAAGAPASSTGTGGWYDVYGDVVGCDYGNPYAVGGPWFDVADQGYGDYAVGGPWYDVDDHGYGSYAVGADPQPPEYRPPQGVSALARMLIQKASQEVAESTEQLPSATYWVWSLSESSAPTGRAVILDPISLVEPHATLAEAMARVRELGQEPDVIARAVFDRSSPHWPNPVTWSRSNKVEHENDILNYLKIQPTGDPLPGPPPSLSSGAYLGADAAEVHAALAAARRRAAEQAARVAGSVVAVIHAKADNRWYASSFSSEDDADDWVTTMTVDPATYTYAAYFNKSDPRFWPNPVIEKISNHRAPPGTELPRRSILGATPAETDANRAEAKRRATIASGNAVVVIRRPGFGWQTRAGLANLDDAIDVLQIETREPTSFEYAAAFEKGSDGTAYFQAEEFGQPRAVPFRPGTLDPRDVATAGSYYWWGA